MKEVNHINLMDSQPKTENQALAKILWLSFLGSALLHGAVIMAPVPTLWKQAETKTEEIVEVVVDNSAQAPLIAEIAKTIPEKTPDIRSTENVFQNGSLEAAPSIIALAPETDRPLPAGKDAPAPDQLTPLTTNNASDTVIQRGGGSIIKENGVGSGFGNEKTSTGFIPGGRPDGDPEGTSDGKPNGVVGGTNDGTAAQAVNNSTPESPISKPLKLECISCPKPQFRGKEGTPRVTYDLTADGKVTNIRLRQSSGDPETDRETLETMSKWQFNPTTIPEGGRTNVKVRVTFEESGSQFQQENEERRRQEVQKIEQQRVADQDRQQREATRSNPVIKAPTIITSPASSPVPTYVRPPEPVYVAPAYVPPLEPIYVAPAYVPPPEPVYVAPDLPPPLP